MPTVDVSALEAKVKDIYRLVAEQPTGAYHFELGRSLAEHLGYDPALLDRAPVDAVNSFAGVGYVFGLAAAHRRRAGNRPGLRFGDGCLLRRTAGRIAEAAVVGIDFTPQQVRQAHRVAAAAGLTQVEFRGGRIEASQADDNSVDCVTSNGVINLSPDKARVFSEAARVLRPGGRLAIADIVSERQLDDAIVCNADLWAACIGGAAQQDAFDQLIKDSGLTVTAMWHNAYRFISERARDASAKYGVKSISLLAVKDSR